MSKLTSELDTSPYNIVMVSIAMYEIEISRGKCGLSVCDLYGFGICSFNSKLLRYGSRKIDVSGMRADIMSHNCNRVAWKVMLA